MFWMLTVSALMNLALACAALWLHRRAARAGRLAGHCRDGRDTLAASNRLLRADLDAVQADAKRLRQDKAEAVCERDLLCVRLRDAEGERDACHGLCDEALALCGHPDAPRGRPGLVDAVRRVVLERDALRGRLAEAERLLDAARRVHDEESALLMANGIRPFLASRKAVQA